MLLTRFSFRLNQPSRRSQTYKPTNLPANLVVSFETSFYLNHPNFRLNNFTSVRRWPSFVKLSQFGIVLGLGLSMLGLGVDAQATGLAMPSLYLNLNSDINYLPKTNFTQTTDLNSDPSKAKTLAEISRDVLIEKTQQFLDKYRMKTAAAQQYGSDLQASDYVDVALKYGVPLDQMMALALLESHFGTNCLTKSGNLTRPCRYKNIFSLGLTSASSSGFNTWRDGLEAFGRWYKRYQDRGVSDCAKWKIFNPNGDYCQKVFSVAAKTGLSPEALTSFNI